MGNLPLQATCEVSPLAHRQIIWLDLLLCQTWERRREEREEGLELGQFEVHELGFRLKSTF